MASFGNRVLRVEMRREVAGSALPLGLNGTVKESQATISRRRTLSETLELALRITRGRPSIRSPIFLQRSHPEDPGRQVEDHCGWYSLEKRLQASNSIGDHFDLISFRAKEPPQPERNIVLDDQNPLHKSRSKFVRCSGQGCCHGGSCHKLFLFLRDRRLIDTTASVSVARQRMAEYIMRA